MGKVVDLGLYSTAVMLNRIKKEPWYFAKVMMLSEVGLLPSSEELLKMLKEYRETAYERTGHWIHLP